jgi:hypothetical protein
MSEALLSSAALFFYTFRRFLDVSHKFFSALKSCSHTKQKRAESFELGGWKRSEKN